MNYAADAPSCSRWTTPSPTCAASPTAAPISPVTQSADPATTAIPLAVELDEICAANGFSRLDRLTRSELKQLVAALDTFEQRVSTQRKAVYDELDALTEELVVRYRVEQAEQLDDE